MGILTGAMTVRRFRIDGEVPEGWRETYRSRLDDYAFLEPPQGIGKEEVEGWVLAHNLLDANFGDVNRWLYDPYAIFSLRIDKKSLPAKLLAAHLDKRCLAWAAEKGTERCPASVRAELKEELEDEWLKRALPRVTLVEVCWNIAEGYLVIHTHSEGRIDRVRKRFFQTFGLRLVPWTPLDDLTDAGLADTLLQLSPAVLNEVTA